MNIFKSMDANIRETGKKSIVSELLNNNHVPGVIYLKGAENLSISITLGDATAMANDPSAKTRLYEINVDGKKIVCILKDMQFNPVVDLPRSFDLQEVKSGDVAKVNIPVRILN